MVFDYSYSARNLCVSDFERLFIDREPGERLFVDSSLSMHFEDDVDRVRKTTEILNQNSQWYVTPDIVHEHRRGLRGFMNLKRRHDSNEKSRRFDEELPWFYHKDMPHLLREKIKILHDRIHDGFNPQNVTKKAISFYESILQNVMDVFKRRTGEVHCADINLVSLVLANAFDGEKVLLGSRDINLNETYREVAKNFEGAFAYEPKLAIFGQDNFKVGVCTGAPLHY